ncbi:MAG: hypothetical protein ACU85E_16150 [Gammaproteobacteria bacterium]
MDHLLPTVLYDNDQCGVQINLLTGSILDGWGDTVHADVESLRFADGTYSDGVFTLNSGNQATIAQDVQIATILGVTGLTDETALESSGTLVTV